MVRFYSFSSKEDLRKRINKLYRMHKYITGTIKRGMGLTMDQYEMMERYDILTHDEETKKGFFNAAYEYLK